MFRVMKLMLSVATVLALTAGTVLAQGYRDAGAKAAGNFGTGFHAGGMQSARVYRSMPVYSVAPAPQVVQSMPAPMAAPAAPQVAQAPTERRSFSVEPGEQAAAPAAPQVIRSYSYEPAAPVYRTPARGRSSTSSLLLPRTDPRKHGG
jgi:hypothetical protein